MENTDDVNDFISQRIEIERLHNENKELRAILGEIVFTDVPKYDHLGEELGEVDYCYAEITPELKARINEVLK